MGTHNLFHQISSAEQPQIYATHLALMEIKALDCQTIIQSTTSQRLMEHRRKMIQGPLNHLASQDVLFILRAGKLLIILQIMDWLRRISWIMRRKNQMIMKRFRLNVDSKTNLQSASKRTKIQATKCLNEFEKKSARYAIGLL